eukprot:gnl/TRDRNA2_/TRDRNA2_153426_c0_seq2.p1 gnl/TRDRNA2_/TRDRNA2_153426_c0~~gnl/TRDRNA2_/TRDRNA2_153426_c0_seq2.p1  ORF type:complete len:157 (-),score=30.63 gnl/TRDRNA2_/TRDRNA2_153426_c0_seq2:225-695(-)
MLQMREKEEMDEMAETAEQDEEALQVDTKADKLKIEWKKDEEWGVKYAFLPLILDSVEVSEKGKEALSKNGLKLDAQSMQGTCKTFFGFTRSGSRLGRNQLRLILDRPNDCLKADSGGVIRRAQPLYAGEFNRKYTLSIFGKMGKNESGKKKSFFR